MAKRKVATKVADIATPVAEDTTPDTVVDTPDIATPVAEDTTPDTVVDTPDTANAVQTTLDEHIEQYMEENLPSEEKKFVKALTIGKDFSDPFSPTAIQSITIHGEVFGTAKTYKDNYFTPVFIKQGKGEEAIESVFYSDKDIKNSGGLTGKQKAYAWLYNIAKERQALVSA